MTNQINRTQAAELQRQELICECHSLIAAIARKPACLKLLGLAQHYLRLLASYKANRSRHRAN